MPAFGHVEQDRRRHGILERLRLLNSDPDPAFDRLTRVAAAATGSPVALLTFLGPDRQWIPSRIGWPVGWTTLGEAFCRCAVGSIELLEVPDARLDDRFAGNPLIAGPQAVRFYAGHPVLFEGTVLGTVCVLDRQPRALSAAHRAVLADLAATASDLLMQRNERRLRLEREDQAAALKAALQRSEAMLSAAQRVAQLGSWELDPASGEAIFSAETLRLLQWDRPRGFADFVAALRLADGRPFAPRLDEPASHELRLAEAGGADRWVRWLSRPVRRTADGGGAAGGSTPGGGVGTAAGEAPGSVVGTLQDISEAKAAERRLRAVEDRFRLLWTTTPDVVVLLGADNLIRFVNPAVRELLGHEPESLIGRDLAVLQPERFREGHRRGFRRYLESGVRRVDWRATEVVGLHRDGREIPIEISFSDMAQGDDERLFAACMRDLSARKRQALALAQSEAGYRRIVETAAEGIWQVDAEAATCFVNPFMAHMLGHAAEAMAGRRFASFLADDDAAAVEAEEARLREAHRGPRELRLRHAGGSEVWVRVVSNPIVDAHGGHAGALAMVTDITALRSADAARRELGERLREAQKMEAIGALAGGVAHDFNNVLAGILGNVGFAIEDVGLQDDGGGGGGGGDRRAVLPYLQQIHKGAVRGRDLVGQILGFARRQPQTLQACELNALVEDSVALLRPTLGPGVRLVLRLAAAPLGVLADATQIGQVVTNLCLNAAQAIGDGGGEVVVGSGRVWLDAEADAAGRPPLAPGPWVHLWVEDDGRGMSEATVARIFEPFFTTRAASDGTGLGLAVVHGIVGAHGGAVAVRSAPGAGSRFDVYLRPCEAGATASSATPGHPEPSQAAPEPAPAGPDRMGPGGHRPRVLYVDDDDVMRAVVERLLGQLGYEPVVHASALDALAALEAAPHAFDAVVSDFNMPGLSGLQLTEALAALRPGLPVIISSGNVSAQLARESARLGVRALVRKQHLIDELAGVLVAALGDRSTGPAAR